MLWLSVLVPVQLALALVTLIVAVRGVALAPKSVTNRVVRSGVRKRRTSEANGLAER